VNRLLFLVLAACGSDAVTRGPDAAPGPFDLEPQCTSDAHWKFGDQRSPLMYPGRACNECHDTRVDTPRFAVSGTVYATGHEPDNCNGAAGVTVEVTAADGKQYSLETNQAGNFMSPLFEQIAFPIRARVIVNGEAREMMGTVATGDCNSCHTQHGMSLAPGRIVLP
jgi:hypothetical protein